MGREKLMMGGGEVGALAGVAHRPWVWDEDLALAVFRLPESDEVLHWNLGV